MATTQDLLVFTTKEEMRAWSRQQRAAGRKIGFVPTMVRVWIAVRVWDRQRESGTC
jgi:hypothetical protein